ncbi:hypothetical protein M011DRAFT_458875 [Sporormia fimetaria CBS 119925]|uniref:Uncharacterized protein n=1 Tax=Sporormia fimetaria CBS 119925 TaxID=1340428 RepID=A0A6A6V8J4_9PLEO|nr:hypothetical protein M011DRAFT_458875 [Sporormia fimetaria CBS 119925]
MPRPQTVSISRPFDARHVTGVTVSGPIGPVVSTIHPISSKLEPDEIPTHLNIGAQDRLPKRSHTIAHTLSRPSLRLKSSISRLRSRSSSNSPDTRRRPEHHHEDKAQPRASSQPPQIPSISALGRSSNGYDRKTKLQTRPKRADSGAAIDFDDVPVEQRPLGFKEIMKVQSVDERLRLYRMAREYWATADHGLEEWVERARGRG